MITARVVETMDGQAVQLPDEFRFATSDVSVRKDGDAVILEPIKANHWPDHFFEAICVEDPAFFRPPQGDVPPAPKFN